MTLSTSVHEKCMQRALALGIQGRITAPPNPWVGCVIVANGEIVGEGFHRAAGEAHAEVKALNEAGTKAAGSSVYVTLEPCAHFGRTPPCVQSLIEAKVSRVFIGVEDPDSRVAGRGVELLRKAGIEVSVGISRMECEQNLAPYLYQRRTGYPYCVAKGAISIDGRVAALDGSSQWITCPEARKDGHSLRAESQAIIVGCGTAIADRPALSIRNFHPMPTHPLLRVVLDSTGRTLPPGPLFDMTSAPTLMITTECCRKSTLDVWKSCGIEVAVVAKSSHGEGVDLHEVLTILGKRGVMQVLVEGGGKILGSFLDQNLLQGLRIYMGPLILGSEGIPLFRTNRITSLQEAPKLKMCGITTLGETVRVDYSFLHN